MRYRPPNLNSDILATSSIGVAGSGYRDPYLDSDLPDLGAAEDMKQIRLNDDLIVGALSPIQGLMRS